MIKQCITLAVFVVGTYAGQAQAADTKLKSGTFTGESRHVTTGGVSIVKRGGKTLVVLAKDFSLDNGPDPKVGFGNNGFVKGTLVGKLKNLKGEQTYEVPASIDVSKFNQVYIWCEQFSVPLGVASIK